MIKYRIETYIDVWADEKDEAEGKVRDVLKGLDFYIAEVVML